MVSLLLQRSGWIQGATQPIELLADPAFQAAVHVNSFEGVRWLRRESLEVLLPALFAAGLIHASAGGRMTKKDLRASIGRARGGVTRMLEAAQSSGYRWDVFADAMENGSTASP